MSETLVEEMAGEEMQVVEECKEGMQQRVRWADIEEEHESRAERSREDQQQWILLEEEMVAVPEQVRERREKQETQGQMTVEQDMEEVRKKDKGAGATNEMGGTSGGTGAAIKGRRETAARRSGGGGRSEKGTSRGVRSR